MGIAALDFDPDCLFDAAVVFRAGIRIVGSETAEGVVRLKIEGECVPDGHVVCQVESMVSPYDSTLRIKFYVVAKS